ncbi:MAG: hypothetical protein LQ340_001155 [Diploschistes diacapsis]|nr:MAG: hypothetical protein LQ340_001155 [Diploschistes diacapsis]
MSAQGPIAFFGATGGCANAALALALKTGYQCSALARTPQRLHEMLAAKEVPKETIDRNLQMVQGDVTHVETVKKVLFYRNQPVSKILSGIGMAPSLNISKMDGTICQKSARTIIQALKELDFERKPYFALISTTGISKGPQDVPLFCRPMYHWLLAVPLNDKRVVEELVIEADEEGKAFIGYTVVRPASLRDTKSKGMRNIRVGSEEKPVLGYFICRDDVGLWIFEELLKGDASRWYGQKPTIAH